MKRLFLPLLISSACVSAEPFSHVPSFFQGTVSSESGLGTEVRLTIQRSYASLFVSEGTQKIGLAYGLFNPISRYQSVGVGAMTFYNNQTEGTTSGIEAIQEGDIPGAYGLLRSSTRVGVAYSTDQKDFTLYGSYSLMPTLLNYGIPLKIERLPDTGAWGVSMGLRYLW